MSFQSHEDEHTGDVLQDSPSVWLSYFKLTVHASLLSFASLAVMFCPNILKTEPNYATSNKFTYKILSGDIVIGTGRTEHCTQDVSGESEGRTLSVETLHVFGNVTWCIFSL